MEYQNTKLKEFCEYIKNKKVAIIGLGVSNIPLLDYLHNLGAQITVFDKRNIDNIDKGVLDKITNYGIQFSLGENNLSKLIGFDIIFRSPSCRPDLPEIIAELDRGAILTSEIEMLDFSPVSVKKVIVNVYSIIHAPPYYYSWIWDNSVT